MASIDSLDRHHRDFREALTRPAVLPVVALAALFLAFAASIAVITWTSRQTSQTRQLATALAEVESTLVDMETGLRGYELERDERFLEPYRTGADTLPGQLERVVQLVADHPEQVPLAADLQGLAGTWQLWADEVRQRIAEGGLPSTSVAFSGKQQMDVLRRLLAQMRDNVEHETQRRQAWRETIIWLTLIIGVVGTTALGIWLAGRWRKALRHTAATYLNAMRLTRQQARELAEAHRLLDREIQAVGAIQQSLLPRSLPDIPRLSLAAHYQTSSRAGGDYYDFFALPAHGPDGEVVAEGQHWGILIADVSGHGTPAAVVMAVTHSIAHGYEHPPEPPSHLMSFVNRRLCDGYTGRDVAFVTAFYAVFNPVRQTLRYSNAGHNPPRLMRAGTCEFVELLAASSLPWGIEHDVEYEDAEVQLAAGDVVVFYTDGITEARNPAGVFFDVTRLDEAACGDGDPSTRVRRILDAVREHTSVPGTPADDQTVIVLQVE